MGGLNLKLGVLDIGDLRLDVAAGRAPDIERVRDQQGGAVDGEDGTDERHHLTCGTALARELLPVKIHLPLHVGIERAACCVGLLLGLLQRGFGLCQRRAVGNGEADIIIERFGLEQLPPLAGHVYLIGEGLRDTARGIGGDSGTGVVAGVFGLWRQVGALKVCPTAHAEMPPASSTPRQCRAVRAGRLPVVQKRAEM